ncbi:MAG: hypothetical protein Q7T77_09370 [Sulfuricurvum sp.]|nr:hypothetical protein [Sulfuricurvum sp.]
MNAKIITIVYQKEIIVNNMITSNLVVELSKKHIISVLDLDVQRSFSRFVASRGDSKPKINLLPLPIHESEFQNLINRHQEGILLIDTRGFDLEIQQVAILSADMVIIPMIDSIMELNRLTLLSQTIRDLNTKKTNLKPLILLNRVHLLAGQSLDNLKSSINDATKNEYGIMDSVLHDLREYKDAYYQGLSVIELDKATEAAKEITALIQEIELKLI